MRRLLPLLLGIALSAGSPPALKVAENGQTDLIILEEENPSICAHQAAEELSAILARISGAHFQIGAKGTGADRPTISLQVNPALGAEGYKIWVNPQPVPQLVIAGGTPRGLLYGVYGLLGSCFGCRWYTPDVDYIPKRKVLTLQGDLSIQSSPGFSYREICTTEAKNGEWAARNRLNSCFANPSKFSCGKVVYGSFVHSFSKIIDPDKYFSTHPEYFAYVNGTRIKNNSQLCLTNKDVLKIAIETVEKWIKENPAATIFSVSQNDCFNYCECDECKKIDTLEGSPSGSILSFVNKVAEAIGKEHPDVYIDTLAYQYSRKPPLHVKPNKNVIIRLCSLECCFSHPLDSCNDTNTHAFIGDLHGWSQITKNLYVWDYITNFNNYLLPFPDLSVLDKNIRTFAANGVTGIFEEGNYSQGGKGELSELRGWVLSQLLWDPTLDGNNLVHEFVKHVYGHSSDQVQKFLDLQANSVQITGEHIKIQDGPVREFLNLGFLKQATELLNEAEKTALISDTTSVITEVQRLRLPVWYAIINQPEAPLADVQDATRKFISAVKSQGISDLSENGPSLADRLKLLSRVLAQKPLFLAEGVISSKISDIKLFREGALTQIIEDMGSDSGLVVRQRAETSDWSLQWPIPFPACKEHISYRIRAHVRVELTDHLGTAFHMGIYDNSGKQILVSVDPKLAEIPDDSYHWYEIGKTELRPGCYFYSATGGKPAGVTAIYVDRVELSPSN